MLKLKPFNKIVSFINSNEHAMFRPVELLSTIFGYFVVCVITCAVLFYLWMRYQYGYWSKKNIYSPPATFPMGHLGDAGNKTQVGIHYMNLYNQAKPFPFVGLFFMTRKTLLVRDLELVRNILAKDFNYFQGHGFKIDKEVDPLEQHMFNLEGEEWKRIHTKVSPVFRPSKIKDMFDTLLVCAEDMVKYIDAQIKIENVIDFKELVAKLGTDVIGSAAFGLQANSFKDPDAEFRKMGKKTFAPSFYRGIVDVLSLVTPNLTETLKLRRNEPDVQQFFRKMVKETIEYREKNNIKRNDLLQLMIDTKKDPKPENRLNLAEITAQAFVFFLGGFETSSCAAVYSLLELARNPDIRDRLVTEIDSALDRNGGKLTYDLLHNMKYLTQVVEEAMRMYPPLPFFFRTCTSDYRIPHTDITIEKGTLMLIPVLGIHRDPDIYPDPMKFDPERFTQENIRQRHPFADLPFGEGPRVCIGARFGMMQVKLSVCTILRNFHVELSSKTKLPLKYEPKAFLLHTEGELLLQVSRRT